MSPPCVPTAQGQQKLSCNPRKENGSHVVLCELGNPMKAGAQVRAGGLPPPSPSPCRRGRARLVAMGHPPPVLPPPQITVDMELSVSGLEDMGDAITFQLQLQR